MTYSWILNSAQWNISLQDSNYAPGTRREAAINWRGVNIQIVYLCLQYPRCVTLISANICLWPRERNMFSWEQPSVHGAAKTELPDEELSLPISVLWEDHSLLEGPSPNCQRVLPISSNPAFLLSGAASTLLPILLSFFSFFFKTHSTNLEPRPQDQYDHHTCCWVIACTTMLANQIFAEKGSIRQPCL